MKQAIRKGYHHIAIKGDSELVVNQFKGSCNIYNANLRSLCNEALELKGDFHSCTIQHIRRELNTEADAQANQAVYLGDGQVEEDRMN
ncbi:putative ribonuclease H [Medicago truncatula]|uniref:Putative ribonuclease H n=2 Tax=Medicago truncatula TaxID=3880 RepID=A0A396H9C6_MEDTR|nr:putative ribonuclease H [Medicago truncatula]